MAKILLVQKGPKLGKLNFVAKKKDPRPLNKLVEGCCLSLGLLSLSWWHSNQAGGDGVLLSILNKLSPSFPICPCAIIPPFSRDFLGSSGQMSGGAARL